MKKAQTILEYVALLTVVVIALIAMRGYMQGSVQGRWKDSLDGLGDPYDPRRTSSFVRHTINTYSSTSVRVVPEPKGALNGYSTYKDDLSLTVEEKQGWSSMAPAIP